jgi:hypothetical protein
MSSDKTCSKCPNSPAMKRMEQKGFIQVLLPGGKVASPSEPKPGFPVSIYECSQCHLVEFYHEP